MPLPDGSKDPPTFPIVCIGGSAGSLPAYGEILRQLPSDAGFAIVVVSHRRDAGHLVPLLARFARMKVVEATDGVLLESGCVFVTPSSRGITTDGAVLNLDAGPQKTHGWPTVISEFLFSVASSCRSRGIAIIVSGMGYDGSPALSAIKAQGGWTLAQSDPQYSGMPQAAIDTNQVDFVVTSEEIGKYLAFLSAHIPNATE
jgi:chemotaxis response regulator CheB